MCVLGNGGYGRLGHKEQKDEFSPKQVDTLKGRMPVDVNSPVSFLLWNSVTACRASCCPSVEVAMMCRLGEYGMNKLHVLVYKCTQHHLFVVLLL